MKKVLFAIIITYLFASCEAPEEKVIAVVDRFLTQVNIPNQGYDNELTTDNFVKLFKGKSYYTSKDWKLAAMPVDSTYIVEAKGNTYNDFGQPMEIMQGFALTKQYGEWQIYDSYNFVIDELAFKVVDTQWDFYWDRAKYAIMNELREKLTLEIIVPGYYEYYSPTYREGKVKIINDSDYDVEGVRILIEHFDRLGSSVNTDYEYVLDIIRKHGYREFEWITGDCERCYTQTYEICFEKESQYQ